MINKDFMYRYIMILLIIMYTIPIHPIWLLNHPKLSFPKFESGKKNHHKKNRFRLLGLRYDLEKVLLEVSIFLALI